MPDTFVDDMHYELTAMSPVRADIRIRYSACDALRHTFPAIYKRE